MSALTKDDISDMSDEQQAKYCYWCFYKDFGNCDNCALVHLVTPNKSVQPTIESVGSAPAVVESKVASPAESG